MFKYHGKTFLTVDDVRKIERKEKGKTVSHNAMYKTLEGIYGKLRFAKRRQGREVAYAPVKDNNQLIKYDEELSETFEAIRESARTHDINLACSIGCP